MQEEALASFALYDSYRVNMDSLTITDVRN